MKNKILGTTLIILGITLMLSAVALVGYNFKLSADAANSSSRALEALLEQMPPIVIETEAESQTESVISAEATESEQETEEAVAPESETAYETEVIIEAAPHTIKIDGEEYMGVLEIPSLNLSLPVISTWTYEKLKIAPCRFEGSLEKDDIIIMAHNFRGHFASLTSVELEADVYFTDTDGFVNVYKVTDLETVDGNDIDTMTSGEWDLTLFTCTLDGKTRYTVRCDRVELNKN